MAVRVLTRQWFPKWNLLIDRIPDALFDLGCVLWGWIYRQRELLAVATKPGAPPVEVAERPAGEIALRNGRIVRDAAFRHR